MASTNNRGPTACFSKMLNGRPGRPRRSGCQEPRVPRRRTVRGGCRRSLRPAESSRPSGLRAFHCCRSLPLSVRCVAVRLRRCSASRRAATRGRAIMCAPSSFTAPFARRASAHQKYEFGCCAACRARVCTERAVRELRRSRGRCGRHRDRDVSQVLDTARRQRAKIWIPGVLADNLVKITAATPQSLPEDSASSTPLRKPSRSVVNLVSGRSD